MSVHALRLLPEFSVNDLVQLQAEDPDIGPAYQVLSQELEPTPDAFRALPIESRQLVSMRPEIFLQDELLLNLGKGPYS